jgi:hypothetical protein
MNCELGRLRVLRDPQDPTQTQMMYDENGSEIVHLNQSPILREQNIALGPFHDIPAARTFQIGSSVMEKLFEPEVNDYADPNNFNPDDPAPEPQISLGPHLSEAAFSVFLHAVANTFGTPPPVVSADPSQPFSISPVDDDDIDITALEPGEGEEPNRPWLDQLPQVELDAILAAEAVERELGEQFGGDPVLPETPCDEQVIGVGTLIGDICGPDGPRPDCRVDLFDFKCLAGVWLDCNDPADPQCL